MYFLLMCSSLYVCVLVQVHVKMFIIGAYKVRGANYLSVNGKGVCTWSSTNGSYIGVSESLLMEVVESLVDNIYIYVGDRVLCVLAYPWALIMPHC